MIDNCEWVRHSSGWSLVRLANQTYITPDLPYELFEVIWPGTARWLSFICLIAVHHAIYVDI
jgi:hypothetical protein